MGLPPQLSCRACETIVQAPMPSLPTERGRPGPGLLAHTLVSKYCDHTALHRQSLIHAREGVELDRGTLAEWVGKAVFLLDPLAAAIGRHIRASAVLHADDTTVPVLAPGLGKTATGRLWVVVRDERPWGSDVPPAAFYAIRPTAKRSMPRRCSAPAAASCMPTEEPVLGPALWLDPWAGFNRLYQPATPNGEPNLVEVACWAHVRRKFYDVHHATAPPPIALEALQRIAALFAIESGVNGRPPESRAATRAEHAMPLLDDLKLFLDGALNRVSGKSTLAQAIRYALSRWKALVRYLGDGRLEMTNNAAERAMRPLVLGRKNYLFCGSDAGGQRAACVYTIIETAKMNGINPQAYLTDVLGRIADHPIILSTRSMNCSPGSWFLVLVTVAPANTGRAVKIRGHRRTLTPEIPLHTNGSENDIRCQVTKRAISGGTKTDTGRDCRDAFLGIAKTCRKLGVAFWDYLGARIGVPGTAAVPQLADLIRCRSQPAW